MPTTLTSPRVHIRVRGLNSNGSLPYGVPIRLLAVASLSSYSSSSYEDLSYFWGRQIDRFPGEGSFRVEDSGTSALEVPFNPAKIIGGESYSFKVTVTTRTFASSASGVPSPVTATLLLRIAPEISAGLSVFPRVGTEYETRFRLNASAEAGVPPLRYRFSYFVPRYFSYRQTFETILVDNSSSPLYSTVLPSPSRADENVTLWVRVTDAMGSRARWHANVSVSQHTSTGGSSRACVRVRAAANRVRDLVRCDNFSSNATCGSRSNYVDPDRLGLCNAVSQWIAVQDCRSLADAVVKIEDISVEMSSMIEQLSTADADWMGVIGCSDPASHVNAPIGGAAHGCADASTAQALGTSVWGLLEGGISRLSGLKCTESSSLQILGALTELSSTPCANESAEIFQELVNITRVAVRAAPEDDLAFGSAGEEAISITSSLVSRASTVLERLDPATSDGSLMCEALNSAVGLTELVTVRIGQTMFPGSSPATLEGTSVSVHASAMFADEVSRMLNISSPGANTSSIVFPRLSAPGLNVSERPCAVVSLARWTSTQTCRQVDGEASLRSAIHAITVALVDESGTARVHESQHFSNGSSFTLRIPFNGSNASNFECAYWDTAALNWNASACTFAVSAGGDAVCTCNHLTEFAVVRRQRAKEENSPFAAQAVYTTFAVVYTAACAWAVAVGIKMVLKKRTPRVAGQKRSGGRQKLMIIILAAQMGLRTAACLLFSGYVGGFTIREASPAALFILLSLPYVLSFGLVALVVFLWIGVLNNAELSFDPFKRFKTACMATGTCLAAIVLSLAGWSVFKGDRYSYQVSSVALCIICTVFLVVLLCTGAGFLRVARKQASDSSLHASLQRLSITAVIASGAFLVQSCLWLVVTFGSDDMDNNTFYAITALYLSADVTIPLTLLWIFTTKAKSRKRNSTGATTYNTRATRRRAKTQDSKRTKGAHQGQSVPSSESDTDGRVSLPATYWKSDAKTMLGSGRSSVANSPRAIELAMMQNSLKSMGSNKSLLPSDVSSPISSAQILGFVGDTRRSTMPSPPRGTYKKSRKHLVRMRARTAQQTRRETLGEDEGENGSANSSNAQEIIDVSLSPRYISGSGQAVLTSAEPETSSKTSLDSVPSQAESVDRQIL